MKSFVLFLHSYMQDWTAKYGSIDLCATSEYPLKKDLITNILKTEWIGPDSNKVKETYDTLNRELNCEIMYDLSDPGEKVTVTEKVYDSFDYLYHEKENEQEYHFVPEGYTTKKEFRLGARYFIRISSENEELLENVAYMLEHPCCTFYQGVSCFGDYLVIRDEDRETDFLLLEAFRRGFV